MSQTKNERAGSERTGSEQPAVSGDNLEDQYRDIGISAVAAAAAYTCKTAKLSQKT